MDPSVHHVNSPSCCVMRIMLLAGLLATMWFPFVAQAESVAVQSGPYAWVAQEMVELRGLPLLHEVKERYITRDEFRSALMNEVMTDQVRAELEASERTMEALGLIPEGTDLFGVYREAYAGGVAGYYDSDANEMVLIRDSGSPDAFAQITYAHEFVHALTDQHFDLTALQEQVEERDDSDADTAFHALVEGDASAAQVEFMLRHPDLIDAAISADDSAFEGLPAAIIASLRFPYVSGYDFVEALRATGGWDAVNAAYRDLPASTEQILHPELYAASDIPAVVSVPNVGHAFGQEWATVEQDTVGEFSVLLLMSAGQPGEDSVLATDDFVTAQGAADGWNGDRYATWVNGEQTAVIWKSSWDSEDDAVEFERALAGYDSERWSVPVRFSPAGTVIDGHEWSSRIIRSDTEVIYVLAPSEELAQAMLAAAG
jgi:hypothetical protein